MHPKHTQICPICGTTFHPITGEINRGRGKFCSQECAITFRQQPNTTCPNCGKAFRAKSRELNAPNPPYCCRACYLEHRFGTDEDRFWSKVECFGPTDCWEWQAGRFVEGYGAFHFRGSLWKASRVAWTLVHGEIPDDLWVLHKCDNPCCCNPAHLFLGTPGDNVNDMFSKGRNVHLHGSDNPLAKLTEDDVRSIRREYATGATQQEISKRYGVEQTTISWIVQRKTWKHVT